VISFVEQLRLAALEAPTAARKLRAKSAAWLVTYIMAAASVLALVAWQLVKHSDDLLQLAMDYVLPTDWHFAARTLLHKFFAQQEQLVITNAVVAAALVIVQITLFPVKEKVSAALEEDARLVAERIEEHPLWFQAWEEIKVFLAMLAAQGTVFWIGYSDDPVRRKLAVVVSFLVLAVNVAVDFLSPVLQRHMLRYSQIIKSLAAHPVLSLGFGALFALPAVGAAALASAHPAWSFATRIGIAFGGQVLGVALAVLGGTVAGAPLIADARQRTRSHWAVRVLAWLLLAGVLAWNGYRFGAVGRSLHHKSQLLKCDYAVDWSSFSAETPSALDLVQAARRDSITIRVSFDVTVANTTGIDVEIEDNRLEVRQQGQLIGQTQLPRGRVAAGTTQKLHVMIPLTLVPSQALRIRDLVTTKDWAVTLYLEIADGFTFPVYLVTKT
jgi:hypothetical protein